MSQKELETLREYYDAAVRAASGYVAECGRPTAALDRSAAAEIVPLCLVMPFLHLPDPDFSAAEIECLPAWLRQCENLAVAEDFCLRIHRPSSAYGLALCRPAEGTNGQKVKPQYHQYLSASASRMVKAREYHAAIFCLRKAIESAEAGADPAASVAVRYQLAELLDEVGHAQLAAEEMKQALQRNAGDVESARAAMLRLKYLYKGNCFAQILEEAPRCRKDQRCRPYLPQILYILWVTNRREGRTEEAESLSKEFLEEFPAQPLGADLHFASAMSALAAGD